MAFLKKASTSIVSVAVDLNNLEYAPEALGVDGGYGKDLIDVMAQIIPLKTDPSRYLYVRNRAISSVEGFGQNENRDAWLYSELKKDYPTFIGAAVCCNHVNDDESKFYGIIPDSAFITSTSSRKDWFDNDAWRGKNFSEHFKYGDQSGWVENILAINKDLINLDYPGLIDDLESGKIIGTSMGCVTGRSVCSLCSNEATNPSEYCLHVANLRSHGLAESDNLYEMNFENTFFEDSIITANTHADEHAIILSKYAEVIPFLRALTSAEEQVRKQIRGEFVPYIKISDKVLTSKKEIESYCKELLGGACQVKEATEKMVGGRIRGHFDMGVREKDITNVERSKKNPAEIGKKYVWDSRNPTKKISSILQNVAGYFKLNEKLADELDGAIKEILEKHSDEIGTMDAITGLVGPTSLAEPPHSYLENLEGADIEEEEEGEDFSDALKDFDPPIIWAEEQERIPEEEVGEIGEEGLEGLEGATPEEGLEEAEPEEEF